MSIKGETSMGNKSKGGEGRRRGGEEERMFL